MRGHRTLGLVGMLLVSVACDKVAEIDVSPDPCRTGETVDLVGKATMRSGKASPVPLKWSLKGDVGSIKDTTLTCGKAGEGSVVAETEGVKIIREEQLEATQTWPPPHVLKARGQL